MQGHSQRGFTLIELSIVLVIIGLIVGGVLTGRELIRASEVRAQISQIEKFNSAANTFYGKYGYLPGDIKDPDASNFGFLARGSLPGEGDGNGELEGWNVLASGNQQLVGETPMFWADLSKAGLIEGGFVSASPTSFPPGQNLTLTSAPAISAFLPSAKIGLGNFVYVYGGGYWNGSWQWNGFNYFGISAVTQINSSPASTPTIPVQQAYNIDKKIDDGIPQSGRVIAQMLTSGGSGTIWANGTDTNGAPYTTATPGSPTSCFDNGNSASSAQQYSITQNGGAGANCSLSFKFQ